MAKTDCTDRVVGAILASWRYDISGISPEMRKDYEQHFTDCVRCSSRVKFHRGLDVALVVLTSLSVFFSLFAGITTLVQARVVRFGRGSAHYQTEDAFFANFASKTPCKS